MNEHFIISPSVFFLIIFVGQATFWLALGLFVSRLLRRRAARAHLVLILATVAAIVSPLLTATVRQLQWGLLPADTVRPADGVARSDLAPVDLRSDLPISENPIEASPVSAMPSAVMQTHFVAVRERPASASAAIAASDITAPAAVAPWWECIGTQWLRGVLAFWLAASLVLALRLFVSLRAGERLVAMAAAEADPALLAALRAAAGALSLRTEPTLRTSPAARSPMIWCWGRKPILLTPSFAAQQNGVSWLAVFCHELAHWMRRDHWLALGKELLVVAIPWHPLAWRAAKYTTLPCYEEGSNPAVRTDRDGRFTVKGIGPERIVDLELRGDTIARASLTAVTRQMAPLTRHLIVGSFPQKDEIFGNEFTFRAYPSRPIVGTVRDAATGKPLQGVGVASDRFAGTRVVRVHDLWSETDADGRYRLTGMPKGNGNIIMAFPNDDQPYFMRRMVVPDKAGTGPVTVDIELHHGVWITGRVVDKATGKPVMARLHYLPFRDNPFAGALSEFRNGNVDGNQSRYTTRPDGTFRLVGLPGRAIVGALALSAGYRAGAGASEIKGMDKHGTFATYRNPVPPGLKWPSALKEINPTKEDTSIGCDFALERGEAIRLTVVDRQAQPVAGCLVAGRISFNYRPTATATFDLENFSPNETRPILIRHKQRDIGKFLLLTFDEKTSRTMTVTLDPCATLVGRLIDQDGVAFEGTRLEALPNPGGHFWPHLPSVVCQADGTFKYPGLVVGCDYRVIASGPDIEFDTVAKRIKIEPGKVINLGDIKLKRRL